MQDYFSSYETDKSVKRWGGGRGENPEKTIWHTQQQNLVCVTCDCKTDQLGSNLRRSVHCLGDGCCQSDTAFFKKKKKKKKKKKLSSRISYQTTLLLDKPKTVSVNGMCSSF